MNVFNEIYSTDINSFEREYMIAETALMIDIERANKEYMLESGLIANSNEDTFFEATKQKSKQNAFSKFVSNIFNGIRNFFSKIINAISKSSDSKEHIKLDDIKKSSTITISKDIDKLNKVTDDEISKGHELLRKVTASSDGISDNIITAWIKDSGNKLNEIAPKAIKMGVALGIGEALKLSIKKKNNKMTDIEKDATSTDTDTPNKERQKKTIISRTAELYTIYTKMSKSVISDIDAEVDKLYRDEEKNIKNEYEKNIKDIEKRGKDRIAKYKKDPLSYDKAFQTDIADITKSKQDAEKTFNDKQTDLDNKKKIAHDLLKLVESTIIDINKKFSSKEITEFQRDAYIEIIKRYKNIFMKNPTKSNELELRNLLAGDYLSYVSDTSLSSKK